MKLLPATLASALLATLACSGCSTPTANQSNHWRIESIGPRITYTFFGYDGTKDGSAWHYGLRFPVVAAVNGAAAGVGLVLACYCDLRFVADDAKLTTSAPRLGLPAEYGLSWVLPRHEGTGVAKSSACPSG